MMAVTEWGVREFVGRTFDSIRPTRLRRLFQRHDTAKQPTELSAQRSIITEHNTKSTPKLESTSSGKSIGPKPSQKDSICAGRQNSELEREETTEQPYASQSIARPYIAELDGETPPYTDGPSRIIMTSDGSKDCIALLLTRDMVDNMNEVHSYTDKVIKLGAEVSELEKVVNHAEIDIGYLVAEIEALPESPSKGDEEARINREMEEAKERAQQASRSKEISEKDLHWEQLNLTFARDSVQQIVDRVLFESRLLKIDDPVAETEQDKFERLHQSESHQSRCSMHSLETIVSIDELNRRATREEVEMTQQRFHSLNDQFETREAFYDSELREYQDAVEEGTCSLSQSEFDRILVSNMMVLTRTLIDAEAAFENALARARALKIIDNDLDQESDFVSHEEDGYRESREAEMAAGVDRYFIRRWMDATAACEGQEDGPSVDGIDDDWDARTVQISDSISLVAEGRSRVRIDRWRESCAL